MTKVRTANEDRVSWRTHAMSFRRRFVTAEAIYGLILFGAVLATSPVNEDDRHLLERGGVASLTIWVAHVVAVTLAKHGIDGGEDDALHHSVRSALKHSWGILLGPIIPAVFLTLGIAGALPNEVGYVAAVVSGIVLLVALGVAALLLRGARWYFSILGGLLAGMAGMVAIVLKAALGH